MVFGIDDAIIAALITAAGATGGGYLAGRNKGGGDKNKQLPTMSPEQSDWLKTFLTGGGTEQNFLSQLMGGSAEAFKNFEAPYKRQFEEEVVPHIAERFGALGTGSGSMSSSGLYNTLASAGGKLSENLAAMKQQYMMDAAKTLLGGKLAALGMKPFENLYQQGAPQGGGGAGSSFANLLPYALMNLPQGGGGGGGGGNQYPLTAGYDTMFRQQGVPGGF